jgi:hypothetical protein
VKNRILRPIFESNEKFGIWGFWETIAAKFLKNAILKIKLGKNI